MREFCTCGTKILEAAGIGPFCPNKQCPIADGPWPKQMTEQHDYAAILVRLQKAKNAEDGGIAMGSYLWRDIPAIEDALTRCAACQEVTQEMKLAGMEAWDKLATEQQKKGELASWFEMLESVFKAMIKAAPTVKEDTDNGE